MRDYHFAILNAQPVYIVDFLNGGRGGYLSKQIRRVK
jgi:hypothetical protein